MLYICRKGPDITVLRESRCLMQTFLRLLLVILSLGLSAPVAWSAAGAMPEGVKGKESVRCPQIFEGELLKIEGQFYIVTDAFGTELRLRVDDRTALIGNLRPGAKVEAQITEDGYATSIKNVRG